MLNIEIFDGYPQVNQSPIVNLLTREVRENPCKIVVLDDDPTGAQKVHDISVYTDWNVDSIREGFQEKRKLFFVLTNSRSFTAAETERVHREIAENLEAAADGRPYLVISRSDSTLRGHYPLETEVLKKTIEKHHTWKFDGEVICPYFGEGGRYTIGNVHYVKDGEVLIPAAETEFAADKTFGYRSSGLPSYVEEKTCGRYKAQDVICISLEDLRSLNLKKIEGQLSAAKDFGKIIVNAIEDCDVEVFAIALYRTMKRGKHFLFRTAAAFVKTMGNISERPLLTREELIREESGRGGVIVAGSYTERTTRQLEELRKLTCVRFIELNSDLVLAEGELEREAARVLEEMEASVLQGETVAVYTRRKLLTMEGDTKEAALQRSVRISQAVQSLVGNLKVKPAFVLAKGGITSSDIGVKALGIKKAVVLGQIQPGIPVWKADVQSRFPGIPYIIFPGNVGADDSLLRAAAILLS